MKKQAVKGNNLELFLNGVYEEECVFRVYKKEVNFIQEGIETLVQKIVDKVPENIQNLLNEDLRNCEWIRDLHKNEVKDIKEKQLVATGIIKVGSFYEGTKNFFPDEFDFIFELKTSDGSPSVSFPPGFMASVIGRITNEERHSLQYTSDGLTHLLGTRKLRFNRYVGRHRPAHVLQFIYENDSDTDRYIHVDLVPAIRVPCQFAINKCKVKEFHKLIELTGTCFLIRKHYSFTETEVRFMRKELSEKHRKVYRILKHLVNGHGDAEDFRDHIRIQTHSLIYAANKKGYSSYMMKTMMIYHHYDCNNTDEYLGPCILRVLYEMCGYKHLSIPWQPSIGISLRETLSESHWSLYRSLKYLIQDEQCYVKKPGYLNPEEHLTEIEEHDSYSSTFIKTIMVNHHYECRTQEAANVKQCTLQVLEGMFKYGNLSLIKIVLPIHTKTVHSISENYLLRKTLSEKHFKVYQFLTDLQKQSDKHNEANFVHIGNVKKSFADCFMNLIIIYHINECTDSAQGNIEYCISQVLNLMCKYDNTGRLNFPEVVEKNEDEYVQTLRRKFGSYISNYYCLQPYLQLMTDRLKSMQFQEHAVRDMSKKSVSRLYFDDANYHDRMKKVIRKYLGVETHTERLEKCTKRYLNRKSSEHVKAFFKSHHLPDMNAGSRKVLKKNYGKSRSRRERRTQIQKYGNGILKSWQSLNTYLNDEYLVPILVELSNVHNCCNLYSEVLEIPRVKKARVRDTWMKQTVPGRGARCYRKAPAVVQHQHQKGKWNWKSHKVQSVYGKTNRQLFRDNKRLASNFKARTLHSTNKILE